MRIGLQVRKNCENSAPGAEAGGPCFLLALLEIYGKPGERGSCYFLHNILSCLVLDFFGMLSNKLQF